MEQDKVAARRRAEELGICVEERHPSDDPIPLDPAELREIPEEYEDYTAKQTLPMTSSFIQEVSEGELQSNWWKLLVDLASADSIGWSIG